MTISNYVGLTGRVLSYLNNADSTIMPVSCTGTKYKDREHLFDLIKYIDIALRGGAGIAVNLDDFIQQPVNSYNFYFYLPETHPDYAQLTDEQLTRWKNPALSYYDLIQVNDSMEENDGHLTSIQDSWFKFIELLNSGLTPIIDLSKLRPSGTSNSKGLTASGAVSFLTIYEAIINHLNKGDLISLMKLCGQMNEVLRRGGIYKNGIVTFNLNYKHQDIVKYLNVPLADIPGSGKKAIRIDKGVLSNKRLMKLIEVRVNDKSLMLMKTVYQATKKDGTLEYFKGEELKDIHNKENLTELYSQVCLAEDTLVLTKDGHYQIKDLVGKDVEIWDGERWLQINNFKLTGENKELYQVTLKDGRQIKATAYHKFILNDGTRKHLHELEIGDLLKEHSVNVNGVIATKSAYLKGFLVAEGTLTSGNNPLLWIYEPKYSTLNRLIDSGNETAIEVVKTNAISEIGYIESTDNRVRFQGLVTRKSEFTSWCSEYKYRLPLTEMLNWQDKFKYEFIAGVMDGDGTVLSRLKNGNPCYSITSISLSWLEDFQILLSSVGIKTTISVNKLAGVIDFGIDRGGEYNCKTTYRMSFNTAASQKLGSLVTFSRLQNWTNCEPVKSFTKGAYNEITSIEQIDNGNVYCCGVPTTNAFALSNGILIGQCVEILFKPNATCVTGDTFITTSDGIYQVSDLVDKTFTAKVNSNSYSSTINGFWSNGIKDVYELITNEGYKVKLTNDHKVLVAKKVSKPKTKVKYEYIWIEAKDLTIGDELAINNHTIKPKWSGFGTEEQGWLVGNFIGNGHYEGLSAALEFWGDATYKTEMLDKCKTYLNNNNLESERKAYTGSQILEKDKVRITSKPLADLMLNFGMFKGNKFPNSNIEKTSSDFYIGFIQGLFDADGTVNTGFKGATEGGAKIVLNQKNLLMLELVQRMLLRLGVCSKIYKFSDAKTTVLKDGSIINSDVLYGLTITKQNINTYAQLIGFSKDDKKEKLQEILNNFNFRRELFTVKFKSLTFIGQEEVFDCTINDVHEFDGNGFRLHNCLLGHINLGQIETLDQLTLAYNEVTELLIDLWKRWKNEVGGRGSQYLDASQDRQIGVGVFGLANLLAKFGITYKQHVEALTAYLTGEYYPRGTVEYKLAVALDNAYQSAAVLARKAGLERAFTIAPTQSCAYRYTDIAGNTTCRNINPPLARRVRRTSHTVDNLAGWYYHGNVETISDPYLVEKLWENWQELMNRTNLAHCMSYDLYHKVDADWLTYFLTKSPLVTTYYQVYDRIDQSYLNKAVAQIAAVEVEPASCSIADATICIPCSE